MAVSIREQAAVLTLMNAMGTAPGQWHHVSDLVAEGGGALRLVSGDLTRVPAERHTLARSLLDRIRPGDLDRAHAFIEAVSAQGVRLLTVLDDGYPLNLQLIHNRPPAIWVRGRLDARDLRAVAVVGTRNATPEGRVAAEELARELAAADVTVVSGLGLGIDAAAHTATVNAGGRTIAVLGAGILAPIYPPENADLAYRISEDGALVSQFWPRSVVRRSSFVARNVVTSGLAAGAVVVEASAASGAKVLARYALEHGKRLFLPERLVAREEWARCYAGRLGATVVRGVDDILAALVPASPVPMPPKRVPLTR